jgi:tetratricopeptide (TPR) repeat protein
LSSLDRYIESIKEKLDENVFSPLFVRLANLYYLSRQYEECIDVCKTGLEIYPGYITAKILLLRAYLKMEYVNEADNLLNELESKISNLEIYKSCRSKLEMIKGYSRQERIYYPSKIGNVTEYKLYEKKISALNHDRLEIEFDKFLEQVENDSADRLIDENLFNNFKEEFEKFRFDISSTNKQAAKPAKESDSGQLPEPDTSILSRIKIITETLADIYARQGNFKEAFNAYNFLLRAGAPNKERIEEKLSNLERSFSEVN